LGEFVNITQRCTLWKSNSQNIQAKLITVKAAHCRAMCIDYCFQTALHLLICLLAYLLTFSLTVPVILLAHNFR